MAFSADLATPHELLTLSTQKALSLMVPRHRRPERPEPREGAQLLRVTELALTLVLRPFLCVPHASHWPAPGRPGAQPRVTHTRKRVRGHLRGLDTQGWGPRVTAFRILPGKAEFRFLCAFSDLESGQLIHTCKKKS